MRFLREIWLLIFPFVMFHLRVQASIFNGFKENWCRQRKWRLDWQNLQKPCQDLRYRRHSRKHYRAVATSPETSEIFGVEIRPAGEYSRFFVQSRTRNAQKKTIGGDSWRVYLDGPSYLAGTVFYHDNGVYEVLFLIMESGVYKIEMILDYTLCGGLVDPPNDCWFINAHCPRKKDTDFSNKLFSEMTGYVHKPLLSAKRTTLTVPTQRLSKIEIQNYIREADNNCDMQCNLLWDGFGRYLSAYEWRPYMNSTKGRGVLWVYGDSINNYFFQSINNPSRLLCSTVFKECNSTYTWIYPKALYEQEQTETCAEISLHVPRVLAYFRQVILRKDMDNDSALLLNAGAHYVKSTSFQSYQVVIRALISEMKTEYKGTPVWKSTTAIHGQTADFMGASRRFITNHRIQLFNAFANSAMCKSNISVLDVYPISASYPPGTKDGIHYKDEVFNPVIDLLERYFS